MNKTFRLVLSSLLAAFCAATLSVGFAASFTTNAISDAFVATGPTGNLSNNNYGGGGALAVAAGDLPNGEFQSVIKFDLSGARTSFDAQYGVGQWSVQAVSLQLSSSPHNNAIYNNVAAGLFSVSLMLNNSWVEGTGTAGNPSANGITYNTLQSTFINNAADQPLGTFSFGGGTSGANSYSLDLSSGLTADLLAGDDVSLRLFAADTNVSYLFSSRSATPASSEPALIVTAVPGPAAGPLLTAGITTVGSNMYPYTNKPVAGGQINWSRSLSSNLVSAVPLNEGSGTNFYDAVPQQSYSARTLSGTPTGATPPTWFTPTLSSTYAWAGAAISNNAARAQAIQSTYPELALITNVTVGYSYATLVQPLDTNTFGRIMDATGAAVITSYLNIPGRGGQLSTTWRDASGGAINPAFKFTVNQWMLVLCTVQPGLGTMYVNGVPVATSTNVNLANSWANQTGLLVYNCTGDGSSMANANFSSWWIWNNRVLSAQEAAQMYANPWSMFHSGSQRGFIKGTKVTIPGAAMVSNVWFYSHAAAGNLRLGIYDNNSPRNLLWQSGAISNTAAGSWITAPVATGQPSTLVLVPGTYWLAWQVDTTYDVPSYTAGTNGEGFFFSQNFGSFPTTLASGQSSAETWSMYLDYAKLAPPSFTGLALQPGSIFQLQLNGSTNVPFSLLVSTNLSDWLRLQTPATLGNGLWLFRDTNAGAFPHRFYRAIWP